MFRLKEIFLFSSVKQKKALILLIFIVFSSCQQEGTLAPKHQINVNKFQITTEKDWFSSLRYIPLFGDSMSSNYISEILKSKTQNDKIYLLGINGINRSLYCFDTLGNQIAYKGGLEEGSKKFYNASDFQIQKDKVFLSHESGQEILAFDSNLNYLKSYPVIFNGGVQSFVMLNDSICLSRPTMESTNINSSLFKSSIFDPLSKELLGNFPGIISYGTKLSAFGGFNNFAYSNRKKNYYFDLLSNTIWEVLNPDQVVPAFQLNLDSEIWITEEEKKTLLNLSPLDQGNYLNTIQKALTFDHVFDFDDYIVVTFNAHIVAINKQTGAFKAGILPRRSNHINTIDNSPRIISPIGFTQNGEIIYEHNAEKFKLYAEKLKAKIENGELKVTPEFNYFLKAASKITPNCSKVITVAKLNNFDF